MSLEFLQIVKNQTSKCRSPAQKKGEAEDQEAAKKFKSNFNLRESVEATLNKMAKDKGDDPSKKIPDGFYEFANSQMFRELLEAMLDYNRELFRLESKQQVLEQEARQRGLPIP
jgi:hypothetical protein